jgi:adenylate cyclase
MKLEPTLESRSAATGPGLIPYFLFFHRDPLSGVPERVKLIVHAQDRQSERLIGLVQILIGIVLSVLYWLAPRPEDAGATFMPVPVALVLYNSFSLLRFGLATRLRLPNWFVGVSIIADIALLLGLIWSFHLQYGQPAAFSLKAPTIAYVFVFIALRALRFDPRYVLAAGCSAAIGWALLTLAAVLATGRDAITHNFTDYITGNKILIGAELDKIFAILLVTGLLTFGVSRAQTTLLRAVREESAGKEVRRFLSRGLAEAISSSDSLIEAGTATEREAAILMLDIRGFTRFSAAVPARDVVAMLTGFHARIIPLIRANGGVVDKFLGDGVMATFGAINTSDSAAADALRALDAILAESAQWQKEQEAISIASPLRVNGAVASGHVVFATLGSDDRLEYTVIGDAVNLAAKLEKHNKIEKTRALFPEATLVRALTQGYRPAVEPERRHSARVAGVDAPIDLCARL